MGGLIDDSHASAGDLLVKLVVAEHCARTRRGKRAADPHGGVAGLRSFARGKDDRFQVRATFQRLNHGSGHLLHAVRGIQVAAQFVRDVGKRLTDRLAVDALAGVDALHQLGEHFVRVGGCVRARG